MVDYINGNKFADFAHYVVYPQEGLHFNPKILKDKAIIYAKTEVVPYLCDNLKFSRFTYIIISHSSDYPINSFRFSVKPPNVIFWFAENGVHEDPSLIPVPIGLENTKTEYGCIAGRSDVKYLSENAERLKQKSKNKDTVFCLWNNETNKERSNIIEDFKIRGIKYYQPKERLDFREYCEEMSNYQYVISPPGNGIDCHRTWEALYMGCYPIVLKNRIYDFYKLPILKLDSYFDLTEEVLKNFYVNKYSLEELNMSYWENKIIGEFDKL